MGAKRETVRRAPAAPAADTLPPCAFQDLLLRLSTRMINLPVAETDAAILETLAAMGQFVAADRAYLIAFTPEREHWMLTHKWTGPGAPAGLPMCTPVPLKAFPWSAGLMAQGLPLVVSGPADYPPEGAPEQALCAREGVQAYLQVPLSVAGRSQGCAGLSCLRPRPWRPSEVALLQLGANMLAGLLERARVARELAERDARQRAIFQAADQVGFIVTDTGKPEARVVEFSPGAERLFGFTSAEVVGQSFLGLIPADGQDTARRIAAAMLDGAQGYRGQITLARKDGTLFPALLATYLLHDGGGSVTGLLGVCLDLSREQRERALMQTLVDSASDPALLLDREGRVLAANETLARRMGRVTADLVGVPIFDTFPPEVAACRHAAFARVLSTGEPLRHQDASGKRHYDVLLTPVKGPDGRVNAVAVYARDISSLVRAEQELLNVLQHERHRVVHTLHDSVGQQLAGTRFLCDALAARTRTVAPDVAEQATTIAALITEAIQQVRAINRGLCPVSLDEQGLAVALQKLAEDVQQVFHVPCLVHTGARETPVRDERIATQLYFIAHELVLNAVRHGKPKGIIVDVRVYADSGELRVTDDGTGLPPDWDQRDGLGLRLAFHRAGLICARLSIVPGQPRGTVATCRFPLDLPLSTETPWGVPLALWFEAGKER